jgi:hypothetical protein
LLVDDALVDSDETAPSPVSALGTTVCRFAIERLAIKLPAWAAVLGTARLFSSRRARSSLQTSSGNSE